MDLELPFELVWSGAGPTVTMGRVSADIMAAEPFWEHALAKGRRTRLVALDACDADGDPAWLAGSIHHMTRCGSTLMLRQLGAIDRIACIVEPNIFVQLLEHPDDDPARVGRRIRALIGLFRRGLAPVADRAVIKWLTNLCRYAPVLRAALPDVPALFLHRAPIEVLASIEREPLGGIGAVLPLHLQGPDDDAPTALPASEIETIARILAANCRWIAREARVPRLDFVQLPAATVERAVPWFGLNPTAADRERMDQVAQFDVKRGDRPFTPDGATKRAAASDEARALADQVLGPALAEVIARLSPLPRRP